MPEDHDPTDEELERRVRHLLGDDAEGGPSRAAESETDPIEAKLAEIEDRARKIRSNNPMPEPPEWKFQRPAVSKSEFSGGNYYRDLGFGLTVLYSLVGPLGAGFGVGYLIDRRTPGSTTGELWGTIIGAICGLVAAVVMISRHEHKA